MISHIFYHIYEDFNTQQLLSFELNSDSTCVSAAQSVSLLLFAAAQCCFVSVTETLVK